ncbi:WNT1-inducible-signaling pathway protein 2 [Trichomycterus rosablanca]|uniref:WNT1-inducible-signaling pathway protein 2 n=1 Tax=Trichomycterus rosablanca TaxID=2290929 RepID=UPI002F356945
MDVKMQNIHTLLAWTLLMYLCCQVCCQQCSQPCQCPSTASTCPKRIPLVLDGCGCCQICARQKGESCTEILVCDKQRGLECDYSASFPGGPGECVSQEELGCELNGVSYKQGEVFQPSCSTHCKCAGGGVTCVPICPENIRLPSPDCPRPRRVQLPGKCCKEWVCEDMDNSVPQDGHTASSHDQLLPALRSNPSSPGFSCINRSTEWSACSRTCGLGISTRVSNQNPACRLEQQMRLCTIRPCQTFPHQAPVWPRRCKSSYRSPVPTRLAYWGCYSTRFYRPRYCGLCTDGRCCTPYQTHTVTVPFSCPGGRLVHQSVMMISSCVCHYNCPYSSGGTSMMSAY